MFLKENGSQIVVRLCVLGVPFNHLFESLAWGELKGFTQAVRMEHRLRRVWGFPESRPEAYDLIRKLAGDTIAESGESMMQALVSLANQVRTNPELEYAVFQTAVALHPSLEPGQVDRTQMNAVRRLNNFAWRMFEEGNASPLSASTAIDATEIVTEGGLRSRADLSACAMILDTVAATLWELGFREQATQCQARAVAASHLTPDARNHQVLVNRLNDFGGSVEPPDDTLLFTSEFATQGRPLAEDATPQQRQDNLAAIETDVRGYLDRVASGPDLAAIKAKLLEENPPHPVDASMVGIVGDLLERIEAEYAAQPASARR